jgi:hypothetical protein
MRKLQAETQDNGPFQIDAYPEEIILDDSVLLADRLLRSLHRNADGHLAAATNRHKDAIDPRHNVAILFVYTFEDEEYTLHEHYVHSSDPQSYKGWHKIALAEVAKVCKFSGKNLHGVYGWCTSLVPITPLRTGDLFIVIDKNGARGVRLAFNTRETKRETLRQKKSKAHTRHSHRS